MTRLAFGSPEANRLAVYDRQKAKIMTGEVDGYDIDYWKDRATVTTLVSYTATLKIGDLVFTSDEDCGSESEAQSQAVAEAVSHFKRVAE